MKIGNPWKRKRKNRTLIVISSPPRQDQKFDFVHVGSDHNVPCSSSHSIHLVMMCPAIATGKCDKDRHSLIISPPCGVILPEVSGSPPSIRLILISGIARIICVVRAGLLRSAHRSLGKTSFPGAFNLHVLCLEDHRRRERHDVCLWHTLLHLKG